MLIDPTRIIAEVLGRPATKNFDPRSYNYICPFTNALCKKQGGSDNSIPYPVCSIWKWQDQKSKAARKMVCVCPKRFLQSGFLQDAIDYCWTGQPPTSTKVATEVLMKGFGKVDFVIADIDAEANIRQFLSVELQAIDITGSASRAYEALIRGEDLTKKPSYGLNWANVYKRFITQLILKGYYHHHWNTKIIAVVQDVVFDDICKKADFFRSPDLSQANVVFMSYKFELDETSQSYRLVIDKIEGTHHSNLQSAVLYKTPPSRNEFEKHIRQRLKPPRI